MKRWTLEEEISFGRKLFARWQAKPIDSFRQSAMWVMNNDWPADCKRPVIAVTTFKNAWKEFQRLVAEFMAGTRSAVVTPAEKPDPEIIQIEVPVAQDPVGFMQAQDTVTLLAEIAARFSKKLDAIHEDVLASRRPAPTATPEFRVQSPSPRPVEPPKPKVMRIAIVGLMKDQFTHVEQAVNGRAQLTFLNQDDATPHAPVSCDHVIITRFVRHGWSQAMFSKFPGRATYLESGGVQAVTQKVFDLISKQ